jgi:hypothetical protein
LLLHINQIGAVYNHPRGKGVTSAMNPVVGQLCGPEQGFPHAIPEVVGADDLALGCGKEPAIKGASIQERFGFL